MHGSKVTLPEKVGRLKLPQLPCFRRPCPEGYTRLHARVILCYVHACTNTCMPMGMCDHAWILLFCGTFPEAVCNNTCTVQYGKISVFVGPCLATSVFSGKRPAINGRAMGEHRVYRLRRGSCANSFSCYTS